MLLLMNSFSTKPIKKHNGTTKNYFILMNFYKMVLFSSKINIFSKLFVPKQFLLFVKYFLRPNLLKVILQCLRLLSKAKNILKRSFKF